MRRDILRLLQIPQYHRWAVPATPPFFGNGITGKSGRQPLAIALESYARAVVASIVRAANLAAKEDIPSAFEKRLDHAGVTVIIAHGWWP
jgi:hypothetical protein